MSLPLLLDEVFDGFVSFPFVMIHEFVCARKDPGLQFIQFALRERLEFVPQYSRTGVIWHFHLIHEKQGCPGTRFHFFRLGVIEFSVGLDCPVTGELQILHGCRKFPSIPWS